LEVLRLKGESTTVRITGSSKSALEEIADKIGATQIEVLAEAIEEYRRKVILDTVNESFARLRENEKARKEYEEELGDWDKTLADGLEGY
jgi:predicted transcriptional regulator